MTCGKSFTQIYHEGRWSNLTSLFQLGWKITSQFWMWRKKHVEAATVSHAIFRVVCMSFVFECLCSGAFYWNLLLPYFLAHSIRYVWATERCFMEYGELGFECTYSDLLLTTAFNPRLQDANALPKDGEVQELLASTDAKWVECIDGRQLKWGEHLGFWSVALIEGMLLFLSSFHCTWHSQHS